MSRRCRGSSANNRPTSSCDKKRIRPLGSRYSRTRGITSIHSHSSLARLRIERTSAKLLTYNQKNWGFGLCYLHLRNVKRFGWNALISRSNLDIHLFPIVFLYRQYLELRLKELVTSGLALVDRSRQQKPDHRLEPLWSELRCIIEEVWPDEGPEDLDSIQDYIGQFSAVDPTSTAFRYPTARDGSPSLPDVQRINLRQLCLVMASVAQLLDGVSSAIDVYLGYKRDMEADGYGR